MAAPNPLHYGVVVGINRYPSGDWGEALKGPARDAAGFADWLTDPTQGGLPKSNVKVIITPEPSDRMRLNSARPRKQQIDQALVAYRDDLIQKIESRRRAGQSTEEVRSHSRLYLFVAGHGFMPGPGRSALLDATARIGQQSNLELKTYMDFLILDGTFGELCMFSDCCRTFDPNAAISNVPWDRPMSWKGPVTSLLGFAASDDEQAFEESGRGYFTAALIDGLRQATDANGYVTSSSLRAYVSTHVAEATRARPAIEQQTVSMPVDKDLIFGPRRADIVRAYRRVVIRFPVHFSGLVELVGPDGSRDRWDPHDGPWTKHLFDGAWFIQRAGSPYDTRGLAGDGAFVVAGGDRDVQF